MIGLFCRISSLLQGSFAKETYHFKEPTSRNHPISNSTTWGGQISRLLEMIGLFCRISSLLQGSFAKETYNLKEPTNRSHPLVVCLDSLTIQHVVVFKQTYTHDMMVAFRLILSIIKHMEASYVHDTMALFDSRWLCSIAIKLCSIVIDGSVKQSSNEWKTLMCTIRCADGSEPSAHRIVHIRGFHVFDDYFTDASMTIE